MSRLAYLLLLCVGLDVSNPLLPGSQRFNPDESIEGVRTQQSRERGSAAEAIARPATRQVSAREIRPARVAEPRAVRATPIRTRRAHRGARDPAPSSTPPSDDH